MCQITTMMEDKMHMRSKKGNVVMYLYITALWKFDYSVIVRHSQHVIHKNPSQSYTIPF